VDFVAEIVWSVVVGVCEAVVVLEREMPCLFLVPPPFSSQRLCFVWLSVSVTDCPLPVSVEIRVFLILEVGSFVLVVVVFVVFASLRSEMVVIGFVCFVLLVFLAVTLRRFVALVCFLASGPQVCFVLLAHLVAVLSLVFVASVVGAVAAVFVLTGHAFVFAVWKLPGLLVWTAQNWSHSVFGSSCLVLRLLFVVHFAFGLALAVFVDVVVEAVVGEVAPFAVVVSFDVFFASLEVFLVPCMFVVGFVSLLAPAEDHPSLHLFSAPAVGQELL
jgi:hypothetical protein